MHPLYTYNWCQELQSIKLIRCLEAKICGNIKWWNILIFMFDKFSLNIRRGEEQKNKSYKNGITEVSLYFRNTTNQFSRWPIFPMKSKNYEREWKRKGLSTSRKLDPVNLSARLLKPMTVLGTLGFCKRCLESWYLDIISSWTFFHKCDIYNLIYVFFHV